MDILKRELAPITLEAWSEIDAQATRSLTATLSARKVVDVTGRTAPHRSTHRHGNISETPVTI